MQNRDPELPSRAEYSLDPEDWDSFEKLAHRALDDALGYLRNVRERPVWRPIPDEVKQQLASTLPVEPQGTEATYDEFLKLILPYNTGNIHPRFWGWVHGSGMASGLLTGLMAAAMNSNCGGREHGAIYVERCVLNWCKTIFGYPETASGILITGTSTSTLYGLAVARQVYAGCDIRKVGVANLPAPMVAYGSEEVHQCAHKAMELMGLGRESLRLIPVDTTYRMRLDLLEDAIRQDRAAGRKPFCVIGSAGTVKTGAIDDLDALATLCQREKLWFHVDGAFGALCVLDDTLRPRVRGIERSDSIGFDFHKWMHVPYDAACLLVRHGESHLQTFSMRSDYLHGASRGLAGGGVWPCEYGIDLSRGFQALKIWFGLKEHGTRKLGDKIRQNCEQAAYLAGLVRANPDFSLVAECTLNIVCFRYQPAGIPEASLDSLNEAIVEDLHESGIAAPSTAVVGGKLAVRCAITNHRSTRRDFEILLDAICAAGRKRLDQRSSQ
jgi:aromatic-L-amino-acid decarboxylase